MVVSFIGLDKQKFERKNEFFLLPISLNMFWVLNFRTFTISELLFLLLIF